MKTLKRLHARAHHYRTRLALMRFNPDVPVPELAETSGLTEAEVVRVIRWMRSDFGAPNRAWLS